MKKTLTLFSLILGLVVSSYAQTVQVPAPKSSSESSCTKTENCPKCETKADDTAKAKTVAERPE